MVSAVQAEHDSVGRLLESRYAAATVEMFEALRERACRSIEDADVIEREDLAGFPAPLDSFLLVAAHEPGIAGWKVSGNSTNLVVNFREVGNAYLRFKKPFPEFWNPLILIQELLGVIRIAFGSSLVLHPSSV